MPNTIRDVKVIPQRTGPDMALFQVEDMYVADAGTMGYVFQDKDGNWVKYPTDKQIDAAVEFFSQFDRVERYFIS